MLQLCHSKAGRLLDGVAAITLIAAVAVCAGCGKQAPAGADGLIHLGVSAPLTGDNAEYTKLWDQGFQLALEEINRQGGVRGRPVQLDWQDSQSDPKQAVNIAQKFVDDPRILAEIGDFSSPASMAASPVYERGGLVQFGFTNSHPDFTKAGQFMFSTSSTQEASARQLLSLAHRYGASTAVLYVNNDWGKSSIDIYLDEAHRQSVQTPVVESFSDTSTDFRPLLLKVRDAGVPVLVIQSYYKSAALIVQQARQIGLKGVKIVWANYNQEFINLAGDAAEGVSVTQDFHAKASGPAAEDFVQRFRARYGKYPDGFNVRAYDAVIQLAWAAGQQATPSRDAIRQALATGTAIPSVINGPFAFDSQRRVANPTVYELVVRHGEFVPQGDPLPSVSSR